MPLIWKGQLPEDDPIFSGQVSFVFRHELPPDEETGEEETGDAKDFASPGTDDAPMTHRLDRRDAQEGR